MNRVEAETKLLQYEIAAGPVLFIDEVSEFPHFVYRPWVYTIDSDQYGTVLYATSPNSYQYRTPHRVKWIGRPLGKDNFLKYLQWTGMGQNQVRELKSKGVI
jgi:crotonobetainyl-CoA:carnitine CoA-transferase CaiB-like acyl-CoA transferase